MSDAVNAWDSEHRASTSASHTTARVRPHAHLSSAKSYILGLGPSVLARWVRYNFVIARLSSRRRIDGDGNRTICAKTYLIARRESRQVRLSVLSNWAVSSVGPPLDEMRNGARGRADTEYYTSHAGSGLGL
jgi:hypothetical protein